MSVPRVFRNDWSIKPNGQAWIDLVKDQWWTDEQLASDAEGQAALRGFKRTYEITVTLDGKSGRELRYREVTSGGSFGANPLAQHIGLGKATKIVKLELYWPATKTRFVSPTSSTSRRSKSASASW